MKRLEDYINKIGELPLKDYYTKEELLNRNFLLERYNNIEIYYTSHNEYINYKAKIFIIGITPGFQQMNTAIKTARKCIEEKLSLEEIIYKCKCEARFSGILRSNIINMLDDLRLNSILEIDSCRDLFKDKDYLLHTFSLIPYPVFINDKNYTGHSPKLIKNKFLMKYVYENFREQYQNNKDVLIIPLGKAVEEVLEDLVEKNLLKKGHILKGFPHPSGANGHRVTQFMANKESMIKIIHRII